MEEQAQTPTPDVYSYQGQVTEMLINQRATEDDIRTYLLEQGLNHTEATILIEDVRMQIAQSRPRQGQRDMLIGGLFFVAGVVLTLAQIGYIFYGAIIAGGFQFFRGLSKYNESGR